MGLLMIFATVASVLWIMGERVDMWCFTVTSDDFTVFEITPEYVLKRGPYPASSFTEAMYGVLDVVCNEFDGFGVYVSFDHFSFDRNGVLHGVVRVRVPFEGVFDDGE